MAWRLKKDRWPNGREYWEVHNPQAREVLVGEGGGVSKYYDRGMAEAARDELNSKAPKPSPLIEN